MPLTVIDHFHPQLRAQQQIAIEAGHIQKIEEVELLGQEQLLPLARFSLLLLIIGGLFFILLNSVVYLWQTHTFIVQVDAWGLIFWIFINIIGYVAVLPLHEALHALAFALWGGKP